MRKLDFNQPVYGYVVSAPAYENRWTVEACYEITNQLYCCDHGCCIQEYCPNYLRELVGESLRDYREQLDAEFLAAHSTDLHHDWVDLKHIDPMKARGYWELVALKLSEAPMSSDMKVDVIRLACHLGALAYWTGFSCPVTGRRYRSTMSGKPISTYRDTTICSTSSVAEIVFNNIQGEDIGITAKLSPNDIWCRQRLDGSLGYACTNPDKPWDTLARKWSSHPLLKLWAWELGYAVGGEKVDNPYSLEVCGSDGDAFVELYDTDVYSCMQRRTWVDYYGKLNELAGKTVVTAMYILKDGRRVGRCLMWDVIHTETNKPIRVVDRTYPSTNNDIREGVSAWIDEQRRADNSIKWAMQPNNYECAPSCGDVHITMELSNSQAEEVNEAAMPWFDFMRFHTLVPNESYTGYTYFISSDDEFAPMPARTAQSTQGVNCFTGRAPQGDDTVACIECGDNYDADNMTEVNGDYYCDDCLSNECVMLGHTAHTGGWGQYVPSRMTDTYCETLEGNYELTDRCGQCFSDDTEMVAWNYYIGGLLQDSTPVVIISDETGGLEAFYETVNRRAEMLEYADDNGLTLIPRAAVNAEYRNLNGGMYQFIATTEPETYLAEEWLTVYMPETEEVTA